MYNFHMHIFYIYCLRQGKLKIPLALYKCILVWTNTRTLQYHGINAYSSISWQLLSYTLSLTSCCLGSVSWQHVQCRFALQPDRTRHWGIPHNTQMLLLQWRRAHNQWPHSVADWCQQHTWFLRVLFTAVKQSAFCSACWHFCWASHKRWHLHPHGVVEWRQLPCAVLHHAVPAQTVHSQQRPAERHRELGFASRPFQEIAWSFISSWAGGSHHDCSSWAGGSRHDCSSWRVVVVTIAAGGRVGGSRHDCSSWAGASRHDCSSWAGGSRNECSSWAGGSHHDCSSWAGGSRHDCSSWAGGSRHDCSRWAGGW